MAAMHPLDEEHPHYERMNDTAFWKRWRAILDAFEDDEHKTTFLPAATFELDANVTFRRSITHYQGVSLEALAALKGAVFGSDPQMMAEDARVQKFIEEANGVGLLAWMEAQAEEPAGMGIGYVYVDAPPAVTDAANAMQEGDRLPFLRFFTAEEVDGWDADESGVNWIKTKRLVTDKPDPDSNAKFYIERWVIDERQTRIFRREIPEIDIKRGYDISDWQTSEYKLYREINHELGVLPMIPWPGMPTGEMMGASFIQNAARHDLNLLNLESWQAMSLYRHANPMPILKSDRTWGDILAGPNSAMKLDFNEDFSYAAAPVDAFSAREEVMERVRQSGRSAAGILGQTSDGPEQTTGIAMRVRWSQQQKKYIDAYARACERVAWAILERVELYLGASKPTGAYTLGFTASHEPFELGEMLAHYGSVKFDIESPTFHFEALRRIVQKMLPDVAEDVLEQIQREIDVQPVPNVDTDAGMQGESS